MSDLIFSDTFARIEWSDTPRIAQNYGTKAATSLAIPRAWTLPFMLVPAEITRSLAAGELPLELKGCGGAARLRNLAGDGASLYIRSSVVGETIWDRGSYASVQIAIDESGDDVFAILCDAAAQVLASAGGRDTGIMIQRYLRPAAQGEFGNLQRISKTRDQWEVATREPDGATSRVRLNSQRDVAADPDEPLAVRSGVRAERLFGAVGAWLNNELLLGRSQRFNCEWITDNRRFYLVQIDEEDEDIFGVNPFQVRVAPAVRPEGQSGHYLKAADESVLSCWDKLEVLEQLWEPNSSHKPVLFFLPLADLPQRATAKARERLKEDFARLIGPRGIVVRTSVRAGAEKLPNLPRTECLTPEAASDWCFDEARKLQRAHAPAQLAFVVHRFVAARASAWARAEPGTPIVEINALWGLPDALQYCPYDIWEVHVPTGVGTDYPEFKSDMLISRSDGGWEYVRVKNELARGNSIGSVEAKDIAQRSLQIAERLGRACHIMWFVGCVEQDGAEFNIPWYWTEAHEAERNPDRSSYRTITVSDRVSLADFEAFEGSRVRQALQLRPTDLKLMRDTEFIEAVGRAASANNVPIILSGSTLAHAYFQLRKLGCTVVTPSEKRHDRVRRSANLGKLVRDKIPERIDQRREMQVTRQIGGSLRKGFLLSKLIEEALEVREATEQAQKIEELADLFEVFRALATAEGVPLDTIGKTADQKREKAGGFEEGLVLLQTAIARSDTGGLDAERGIGEVLGEQTSEDAAVIPFSFFGFMELDQPRSITFERFGIRLDLVLRPDRLELRILRASEQLEFEMLGPQIRD